MTGLANPYVGPRSFRAGEELYGRDREVQELLDQVSGTVTQWMQRTAGAAA